MEFLSKQRKAKLEACISLENLVHNFRLMREKTKSRVCCVIKADAYGHGAWQCARTLAAAGADFFAVSSVAEAEEVRLALAGYGDDIGILILGYTLPTDADLLIKYNIRQAVFSAEYARALRDAIREYKLDGILPPDARLGIHIKVDTGGTVHAFCDVRHAHRRHNGGTVFPLSGRMERSARARAGCSRSSRLQFRRHHEFSPYAP